MSVQFPFLAKPYTAQNSVPPGGTPWNQVPGYNSLPKDIKGATGIQYPGGFPSQTPAQPKNWLSGDPFQGVNMDKLGTDVPWLSAKIGKYQAGQGQLGSTYQYLLGNMGRAFGANDVFSENEIRNAGLADQVQGAAGWDQQKRALQDQAALDGSLDSGDFGKQVAIQGSQADLAAQTAAADQMRGLQGYNDQTRLDDINTSLSAFQQWAENRRRMRMSDAGAGAMVAAGQAQADALRRAGTYSALSGAFCAAGSVAGGWGKK